MLTRRQATILAFLDGHIRERGFAPSYEEIAAACGLRARGPVKYQIDQLEARGFIRRHPRLPRSLEVLRLPPAPPAAADTERLLLREVATAAADYRAAAPGQDRLLAFDRMARALEELRAHDAANRRIG